MGTWGVSIYSNDTASDLRDDFRSVVRAPWDGEGLSAWAGVAYPALVDPSDSEHTDVSLALADLFWTYGIDHPPTIEAARRIVADGADLASKRQLGMSERDVRGRSRTLDALVERWQAPNPKPRPRRILQRPEPFVLEAGDVLAYPTTKGMLRNPYVGARAEASYYTMYPWEPDGWGLAIVLSRYHKFEVFARYVVALLGAGLPSKPSLAELAARSILHTERFRKPPRRRVHAIAIEAGHLRRMQVEVLGRLTLDEERIAEEVGPTSPQIAGFGSDLSLAGVANVGGRFNKIVEIEDPIVLYLRAPAPPR